jgi:hypothetical protein
LIEDLRARGLTGNQWVVFHRILLDERLPWVAAALLGDWTIRFDVKVLSHRDLPLVAITDGWVGCFGSAAFDTRNPLQHRRPPRSRRHSHSRPAASGRLPQLGRRWGLLRRRPGSNPLRLFPLPGGCRRARVEVPQPPGPSLVWSGPAAPAPLCRRVLNSRGAGNSPSSARLKEHESTRCPAAPYRTDPWR